ncbi:hypothetical protein BDV96DRAFT_151113 [Lophiotrema nucula]|uniref:Mid2 domain-containing protein n=1 Tax=Lophiotrema nucula TaxID=690887 RepID=A0A6A5Z203_9PLEO|nr:hypothetical protein BDV96DRAFT_151113 [Lophiotrema nucula]
MTSNFHFFILLVISLVPFCSAEDCKAGLDYCGWNLLQRSNYSDRIEAALLAKNQPTTVQQVDSSIFFCWQGGDIEFQVYCGNNNCQNGGTDRSDYCYPFSMTRTSEAGATSITSTVKSSSSAGGSAATSSRGSSSKHETAVGIGIGVGVGVGGTIIVIAVVAFVLRRRFNRIAEDTRLHTDTRNGSAKEMNGAGGASELLAREEPYELGHGHEQRPAELEEVK